MCAGAGGALPPSAGDELAPPAWIVDENARAEWRRRVPELKRRKQYISLFESEFGRYCVFFGQYIQALAKLDEIHGPVTESSKGVDMLSMWWVVATRAHEAMRALASDLGLNPVAQVRLAGVQLDLFDQPLRPTGTDGAPPPSPFSQFRRP